MISIVVTSVGHFDDHIVPLYQSLIFYSDFEFILMMDDPYCIRSRAYMTNKALESASGDWLIVLDNDVRCNGGFFFIEELDPAFIYGAEMQQSNPKWLNEWCMIIPRKLYEQVGGFDTGFKTSMACGGADYCIRANRLGWETRIIDLPFVHLEAGTKNDNPNHEETRVGNHAYLREKWKL